MVFLLTDGRLFTTDEKERILLAGETRNFPINTFGMGVKEHSGPEADLKSYRAYFKERFPDYGPEEFNLGMYTFNDDKRAQWEAIMVFPPYGMAVDRGEQLFNAPFENGKTYADCFDNGGDGVKQNFPYFDSESGEIITLEYAINQCRNDVAKGR